MLSVPNVKTGDVFYVTTREGKLLAVRIKKSYINIPKKSIICDLEFPKGIEIKFGVAINKCKISYTYYENGEIRLVMEDPTGQTYVPVFACIYKTLDDARNGIAYNDKIDLYSLPCYPKGFKSIDLSNPMSIRTCQWGVLDTIIDTHDYMEDFRIC